MRGLTTAVIATLFVEIAVPPWSASQSVAALPAYEVVSIQQNRDNPLSPPAMDVRPNGSLALWNVPIMALLSLAYPGQAPVDMVNLPGWATTERYDVNATAPLSAATQDQRSAMIRTMLAERLKMTVHFETRNQPVYDLIMARPDKRLGPMMKPSEVDCVAREAAERAAAEAARAAGVVPPIPARPPFDPNAPAAPCTRRSLDNGTEGDYTMALLAQFLLILCALCVLCGPRLCVFCG